MKKKKLIDQVDDGFNYFNGYRLEELKSDDVYYIEAFMKYIEHLEFRIKYLNIKLGELKTKTNESKNNTKISIP